MSDEETKAAEDMDPSVPTDLLELGVELELTGKTPEELKEWSEA